MKAKKENKVYRINTEQERQRYLKDGFDVYDDDGTLLEYSPRKKIAFSEYMKAVQEIERLQGLVAGKEAEIGSLRTKMKQLEAEMPQEPDKKAGTKKAGG